MGWMTMNMHTQTSYRKPRGRASCWAAVCLGALLCAACGGTKELLTKNVSFRCDSKFNDGFILPVDIVYIPDGEKVDTVAGVSPDEWFDSPVREEWPSIESMSFRESEVRNTIKVKLKKPAKTIAMVVIADYRGIDNSKAQMIVFDDKAKEHEDIFITINGLLH